VRYGILLLAVAMAGCTSLDVRPIASEAKLDQVCIRFNPEVNVDDFVNVVQDDFAAHHVQSVVFKAEKPASCHFTADYSVDRWWDLGPYMVDAKITVDRDNIIIGSGHYHLNGHGGFDLAKWAGTRSKFDPVMDEMLKNYPKDSAKTATNNQ
jgi:hypothetical protein